MNRNSPKISVCIPTFNQAHFLREAISSVLAQTLMDFELIVVDNCSPDDTRQVVEDFMARDARIKYYRNEENIGAQNNFNRCLRYASGEYVKLLCSDDLLEPHCLERSAEILDRHPNVSLVASARLFVDKNLQPVSVRKYSPKAEIVEGAVAISRCLTSYNLIGEPSATLFRRSLTARGWNTKYRQMIDLEFWFHLLEQGDFASIPEPLCKFRQHEGQDTHVNLSSNELQEDMPNLYNDYFYKDYVKKSFFKKTAMKFIIAQYIWDQRNNNIDRSLIRYKISEYCDFYVFILLSSINRVRLSIARLFRPWHA